MKMSCNGLGTLEGRGDGNGSGVGAGDLCGNRVVLLSWDTYGDKVLWETDGTYFGSCTKNGQGYG